MLFDAAMVLSEHGAIYQAGKSAAAHNEQVFKHDWRLVALKLNESWTKTDLAWLHHPPISIWGALCL